MTSYDWRTIKELVKIEEDPVTCFQITPDKSVTNHTNYKFFKDVFEFESATMIKQLQKNAQNLFKKAVKKNKDKFTFTFELPSDQVWFEIVMKGESIKFFILCKDRNKSFVQLKLQQVFPKSKIVEVDREETKIPSEDTVIADMKLQRHNFFSLRHDYTEQAQPIEDILTISEDVKDDDVVKFSLRVEPYDQNYWSYKSEEWEKHVSKGKTPKRLRVTKSGIVGALFGASDLAFHKLSELFREIHEVAFKKQKNNTVIVQHASTERREIGDISRQTRYKTTAPIFRSTIRIASHSKDDTRRKMNLKALSNSFIDLKDTNNSLVRTTIYEEGDKMFKPVHKEISEQRVNIASRVDVDYTVLCDKELGKLMQLPPSRVQQKYADKLESISRTQNEISPVYKDDRGCFIGTAEFKEENAKIYVPRENDDEFVLPILASGMQGVGKDTFAINWVRNNSAERNIGAVILDIIDERERGMTDMYKSCIEPEKLVVLDFAHPEYTPYLDWAEGIQSNDRFAKARLSTELCKFFDADEDGGGLQTERYLKNCVKALPNASLIEIGMIMVADSVRRKAIETCEARGDIATAAFWKAYEEESEGRRRQIASPVLNRLSKLIDDVALKPIFGQTPDHTIDFDKMLSEGKVIVCKIPKVAFGQGIKILCHFITVKVWLTKQIQMAEGRKCVTSLVVNEPHQIFSAGLENTFAEIFPEARKYGLQMITLFHDIAQIPRDLFDIMVQSGANFVLYKQKSDKAWKRFGDRIFERYDLEECMKLNKFEALIGFLNKAQDLPVLRVKMNDMPTKRGCPLYDNEETVKECLSRYHKPIAVVDEKILELEMEMLKSFSKKKEKTA